MRTDELVQMLAVDARAAASPRTVIVTAALASGAIACLAFVALVGVRPDLLSALADPRVAFKFAFAASAMLTAVTYGQRACRPNDRSSPLSFALPVLVLLAAGTVVELTLTPRVSWPSAAIGVAPLSCLGMIVAVALLPVAALLVAMRSGAPRRPALAGGAAGVGGGAIGAAVFALYCPNDSALFVTIWYGLALGLTGAIGAAIGSRELTW